MTSSSSSDDADIEANKYRFSGYNLPMIQLDETGPSYVQIEGVHPYYKNQPEYWRPPIYGGIPISESINKAVTSSSNQQVIQQENTNTIFSLIPFD